MCQAITKQWKILSSQKWHKKKNRKSINVFLNGKWYLPVITYKYHGCLKFHFFSWLITPFRDNGHLTAQQRRFNRALSSIQQKIERAIKGRWRKLLLLDHLDLELEVYIIVAAWVLHNFCLLHDDFDDGYLHDGLDDNDDDAGHHPADGRAEAKRTHLMNTVCP